MNRTGSRYLWLRLLWCKIVGHQAPYFVAKGEWVKIGDMPDGSTVQIFREGMRLEYVCPRCGEDTEAERHV